MSTNRSNKNHSFIGIIRILFLLTLFFSAVLSCGDDSNSSAPTSTAEIAEKPGAPTSVIANVSGNSIFLSWTAPTNSGKNADGKIASIIGYALEYSNADGNWITLTTSGEGIKLSNTISTNTSASIIGVTYGTIYFFRVIAINEVGKGLTSVVKSVLFQNNLDMVSSITVSPDKVVLSVSSKAILTFSFSPATATNTNVTWTSSDAGVATVSSNGDATATVTAVGGGVASVIAQAGGLSAPVTVTVLVPPANFRQTSAKSTEINLAWDAFPGTTYKLSQIMDDGMTNSPVELNGSPHTVFGLTANTYYRYQLKACAGTACSDPVSLLAVTVPTTSGDGLAAVIDDKVIPANLSGYNQMAQDIFSGYAAGTAIVPRYVLPGGAGNQNGESWSNAAANPKIVLDGIGDSSSTKVYAVLLGPGVYYAGAEMTMKNYITIAGGVSTLNTVPVNTAAVIGPTVLNGSNSYRVFNNNGITNSARLYGVTIADGKASDGGGMNNDQSSPALTKVIFSGNTATNGNGGGMNNDQSSPALTEVIFSGNTATRGGGMYNIGSSLILTGAVFTGNTAGWGGGMANSSSSPVLSGVVFSGNTATGYGGGFGGGMYNFDSSLILTGMVFSGNTSSVGGSRDGINNSISSGTAVNIIFWGQSVRRYGTNILDFYYSVVEGGIYDTTNNIVTNDPGLLSLADNGGSLPTMAIPSSSSAKDKGIYVRRKGSIHYYSIDNKVWYATPKLDNAGDTPITLPTDTIDLTAFDMRGKSMNGRPDIGVYEVQ